MPQHLKADERDPMMEARMKLILRMVCAGMSAAQIAIKLTYNIDTIKRDLRILRVRYDATTTAQMVHHATLAGDVNLKKEPLEASSR